VDEKDFASRLLLYVSVPSPRLEPNERLRHQPTGEKYCPGVCPTGAIMYHG